jgi:hypothetical protein
MPDYVALRTTPASLKRLMKRLWTATIREYPMLHFHTHAPCPGVASSSRQAEDVLEAALASLLDCRVATISAL